MASTVSTITAPRQFPEPRTGDLRDAPALGWGVLGAGRIAEDFVTSLLLHTDQRVVAVGSRTAGGGSAFAARHGVSTAHSSYQALVNDPAVDVVYVSTPNHVHAEAALLALRAGKHVLVEKSFALNAGQAGLMVAEAESRGLFVMEAMWPRFLPYMDSVRQLLDSGGIGEPISLTADLGDFDAYDPTSRMYSPELGGGITLDRGVYLAALSSFLIGPATTVSAVGLHAATGVDAHLSMTLGNGRGAHAQLLASMYAKTPGNAYLSGMRGSIHFAAPWYLSPRLTLLDSAGIVLDTRESALRRNTDALCYEAVEVARCIGAGRTGSALMPARESLAISTTLDAILSDADRHRVPTPIRAAAP